MAYTWGTISQIDQAESASWTVSHNNTGTALVVIFAAARQTLNEAPPTGITFGAQAFTQIDEASVYSGGTEAQFSGAWYLLGAASGTDTVTVTWDAAAAGSWAVYSLSGIGTLRGSAKVELSNDTTPDVTVTTVSGDLVLDIVAVRGNNNFWPTYTQDGSQTQKFYKLHDDANGEMDMQGWGATETATGTSTVMSGTVSQVPWVAHLAFAFTPAISGQSVMWWY